MVKKTKFKDLVVFENKSYRDNRGYFKELIKEKKIKRKFPFMVMSYSKKNVIRGLHIQRKKPQGKFISVIKGKILDVAVDLRKYSNTYGKYFSIILSEKNSKSVYVPPGFAHGFCGLEKENYIIYNCTNYRHKKSEIGIQYNDKSLKIKWPIKKPIISKKDKKSLSFSQYKNKFEK
tara:strand:- start:136 stop:663 length:528 start_codon:yes stop_codon:yes gene_type:complete